MTALDTVDWSMLRRRRAVLIADLVESVRLMQHHEAATIGRWRQFVACVVGEVVPGQGGRLVRTAGDGLLIDVDNAAAAVRLAFGLHQAMAPLNDGRGASELMQLRVGIHVAEVVVDDDDIQGAGANLAARLATLGQPGDTLVSATARDGLVDGVDAEIDDLGERWVKGLDEPVRVFRVLPPGAAAAPAWARERVPLPAGDELRPAVAVVPFVAMPSEPQGDAIGHALADEIIATLARHPGLRVLSSRSTAALAHAPSGDLQRLLGKASFVLGGRCYLRGDRVRVRVELTDLRNDALVWSDGTTVDVDALFEGQDTVVPHVVANVVHQIAAHELARARTLPMPTLGSYTLYLGGYGLMNSLVRRDFARARDVFDHLVERHPRQAAAHAMLARWHLYCAVQGWVEDAASDRLRALEAARRAIDLDPDSPLALVWDGKTRLFFDGDRAGALQRYLRALERSPQDPQAWACISEAYSLHDRHEEALDAARRAIAVSPLDPSLFLFESYAARAAIECGRYEDAIAHARSSLRRHVLHGPSHRQLVGALWLAGHHDEAREAARQYLRAVPSARVATGQASLVDAPPGQFSQALRAAGVPP